MKQLIVLGVTGSVAAVRSFGLCRELRRRGFGVQVVMSDAAQGIITEDAMGFASGKPVISKITGKIEHVKLFGAKGKAGLLLIAPATANTISKIAMGIDDTPVTTMATVAIGAGKPVLLAPAMHKPMYGHPIVAENLKKLESRGVMVISPLEAEGKAKLAGIDEIVFEAERALAGNKFAGKKILVATGAIQEPIDDVRALTNRSTGELGTELALECLRQKGKVKAIGNKIGAAFLEFERADFAGELEKKVMAELAKGYDYFLCPAAIPDFSAGKRIGKIGSAEKIVLELAPREKLLGKVREKFPLLKVVAFKALWGKKKGGVEKAAKKFLKENGFHAVAAADLKAFAKGGAKRGMFFCSAKKSAWIEGTKQEIAAELAGFLQ